MSVSELLPHGSWILTEPPEATCRNKEDEGPAPPRSTRNRVCTWSGVQGGIKSLVLHTCTLIA